MGGAVHRVYAAKPMGPRDGQHQALYEVSICRLACAVFVGGQLGVLLAGQAANASD